MCEIGTKMRMKQRAALYGGHSSRVFDSKGIGNRFDDFKIVGVGERAKNGAVWGQYTGEAC
jgi:hypothetical protein